MNELGVTAETARFPVQAEKLEAPPLRDGILHRERLLGWLDRRIHHRVVTVVAEAGYGKTTLLADFASRTRLATLWYRLDEEDRDPVAFLNYLVAAGRRLVPTFAPTTAAMLRDLGSGGHSHDVLVRTLVRELRELGDGPIVLILDDLQLVDDVPEIRTVLRDMVAQAPERLTFVLSSRRQPTLALSRLRARGELEELTTEDLRFRADETDRLFRDAYDHPLAIELSSELTDRTQGWAATLQLVRTAVRDRDAAATRAFILGLDGRSDDLHDFLAEEVVGELQPDLRRMLMRSALLQIVTPELAGVAAGVDETEARRRIEEADRLGLLSRRGGSRWRHRYHPLVRDFLVERLVREVGSEGVRALHRSIARHVDGSDWRQAAYHWAQADEAADLHRVLAASVGTIMGTGEFALADGYLATHPPGMPTPAFEIVLSRLDFYRNRVDAALERARWAASAAGPQEIEVALANQASLEFMAGFLETASSTADRLAEAATNDVHRSIAAGLKLGVEVSLGGSLREAAAYLREIAALHSARGLTHFHGITLNNLVSVLLAQGQFDEAISTAQAAEGSLASSGMTHELAGLRAMAAAALALSGSAYEAARAFSAARQTSSQIAIAEVLIAQADIETWIGSADAARSLMQEAAPLPMGPDLTEQLEVSSWALALRIGQPLPPGSEAMSVGTRRSSRPAETTRALVQIAHNLTLLGRPEAADASRAAANHAGRQGATVWERCARLLEALNQGGGELDSALRALGEQNSTEVSMLAELLIQHMEDVGEEAVSVMAAEALRHPRRWLAPLRAVVADGPPARAALAGELLERIGEPADIRLLNKAARRGRLHSVDKSPGRRLAKRLAERVWIEDQGRLVIYVGDRIVEGTAVRRKALALLAFLLTRPEFSATRDQVIDALWPDGDPSDGHNSLHQTLYFVRRIFEPEFNEETSPGYVTFASDVVWLDAELISSRSARCRRTLANLRRRWVSELVDEAGARVPADRFGLEFAYEEWAASYRDFLHASYLEAVEREVRLRSGRGEVPGALRLAQAALEADPDADEVDAERPSLVSNSRGTRRSCRAVRALRTSFEGHGRESPSPERDLGVVWIGKVPY